MKPLFLIRLGLDFTAAGLLLTALAYSWMGNLVHEVIGTAMFALLIGHNLFNRRWYGTIAKGRLEPRQLVVKGVNVSLLVSMLALLVTSVIISEAVFSFLPITSSFSARQMHTMLGYVALLIVSVHLGLHWTMIMGVVRKLCGITSQSRLRTYALRAIVIVVAALGIQGLAAVNLGSKLTMEMALLLWDFESEALGFFVHHAAIVGLGAVIGHYAQQMLQMRQMWQNKRRA